MEEITRPHNFTPRLVLVEYEDGIFKMYHEKATGHLTALATTAGLEAFKEENWSYFERLEASLI